MLILAAVAALSLSVSCLAPGAAMADPSADPSTEAHRAKVGALAKVGQDATTHRAGDLIVYRFACHDAESMIALAERGGANEIAAVLVEQGLCFRNRTPIAARLEAWVGGPYAPDYGQRPVGPAGSVWRVVDQYGDTEYVWINDLGGRHAGRREMAL